MTPEFIQAIHARVESETLPMVEALGEYVQTLPLHPAQKFQILKMVAWDFERIQKLCWEGTQEILDEWETQTIRTLKRHNKL